MIALSVKNSAAGVSKFWTLAVISVSAFWQRATQWIGDTCAPLRLHVLALAEVGSTTSAARHNSPLKVSAPLASCSSSAEEEPSENPDQDYRPRAASYSRFSSENQSDSSITDQQRLCRERAETMGMVIPPELEYSDYAVSGTKLDRDGLNQMLRAAAAGEFQVIFFYSLSRLGRETAITVPMLKKLVHEYGIRVVTISEGVDSNQPNWEMFSTISNVINEQHLRQLRSDVLRGLEGTLLAGYSVGDHRFGYRTLPSPDGARTGRGHTAKPKMVYAIDEDQAIWVRRIFAWFVDERRTIGWIVNELNRLQAPKDHRSTTTAWAYGLVIGVLRSPKYICQWQWGLWTNTRRPSDGKVTQKLRPAGDIEKWDRELPDLRIVAEEQFHAAQKILDKNAEVMAASRKPNGKLRGGSHKGVPRHMLEGLIECAKCGAKFHTAGSNATYVRCHNYAKGLCDCGTMLPRALAEELILKAVIGQLDSNTDWRDRTFELTLASVRQQSQDIPNAVSELQQKLASLKKKIEGLLDQVEDGNQDPNLAKRLAQRTEEERVLTRQFQDARSKQVSIVPIPTREWFDQCLLRITELIQGGTPAAYLALRQLLVTPIRVTEIEVPGRKRCFFQGTLRLRIGRLESVHGLEQTTENETTSEEAVVEITLDFRDRSAADEQQALIWTLHEAGKLGTEIAVELGISRSRVSALLRREAAARGLKLIPGGHLPSAGTSP